MDAQQIIDEADSGKLKYKEIKKVEGKVDKEVEKEVKEIVGEIK